MNCLIGVCGCMSQEESVVNKILKSYQNVDMVLGHTTFIIYLRF